MSPCSRAKCLHCLCLRLHASESMLIKHVSKHYLKVNDMSCSYLTIMLYSMSEAVCTVSALGCDLMDNELFTCIIKRHPACALV